MNFLKSIVILFLSISGICSAGYAQQISATYAVNWRGYNKTALIQNQTVSYPMGKDVFIMDDGTLVLTKDITGKITGPVTIESVEYYAGDSSSKAALKKLTLPQKTQIIYDYLYNDHIITRVFIPLLQKNADSWSQLSSVTIQYTLTSVIDDVPVKSNPYGSAPSYSNARIGNVTGSVLASGDWYKFAVSSTGIYKIDAAFLNSIGINTSTIDPAMIQVYGNGGGMLPQANSASRIDDLAENAIFLSEDGNGVFDNNDYFLFYAESPHTWLFDATNKTFSHEYNLYSDQNFYFITFNQQPGKRISSQASIPGTAQTVSTFDEHAFTETDTYNLLDSGREWYGFQFSQFVQNNSYSFNVNGIVPTSSIRMVSSVVGRSYNPSSFNYTINGSASVISTAQNLPSIVNVEHTAIGKNVTSSYTFNASALGGSSTLTIGMKLNGLNAVANANYIELQYQRSLRLYGTQTSFRTIASITQSTTTYSIANTTGSEMIWNVTEPQNISSQSFTFTGSAIEFGANSTSLNEYIVFKGSTFDNPAFVEKVPNQNLHSLNTGSIPDMIIVTDPSFLSEAQRLANFREHNDGISIYICTASQIYNEFGCGKKDLTAIRDFFKMVYDRGSGTEKLKYVLLFGAATYDYKNHLGIGGNFIPTYESRESLAELASYNSDDYYGFMDNTEGAWIEDTGGYNTLNIGIGRIPARTPEQAATCVNKIISASKPTSQTNGDWKNKMTLVADDGNDNLHLDTSETMANQIAAINPQMNINKIYMDAYPQEAAPGGKRFPQMNNAINRDIDEGTLIWNYTGHGGNNVLAQEEIVTISSINSWTNINHLPFFITATCSFGRFDKPGLISGAEQIFMSSTGGSLGNFTSTRTVLSNTNADLNSDLYDYIFDRYADGSYYRLGDIIKNAKNAHTSTSGVNNRNYTFLGDPSMRMCYPIQNMVLTSINGNPINAVPDTLKALSKVTMEGLVQDFNGVTLTGYTGAATITIYDKPTIVTTLGGSSDSPVINFPLQNNIIFNGSATVTAGVFSVSFVVPKDISYQYARGKVSLYSENSNGSIDAGGYLSNVVVGGSNPNAPVDKTPPTAKLYINDPSFVSGGATRENPIFYADVADENGINISTSGIGHEITLTLSNSTDVIILNKYYVAAKDDYTKGKVTFPLGNLSPGTYSLRFKVWDTYNNSTEEVLEFTVESTSKIQLSHVLNYPNPFSTNTTFHFDHNRFGDNLMIQIQIYTVSGKLVKTLDETVYNSPSHISDINWDGLDDYGDKIGRGVYVYKLKIRSLQDGSTTHVFEKLVLL